MRGCGRTFQECETAERHEEKCTGVAPRRAVVEPIPEAARAVRKGARVHADGLGSGVVTRRFGLRVFLKLDGTDGTFEVPFAQVRVVA